MTTKAEMRQRVGEDLSLVPVGQDLEFQDQARIDATFEEVYARLKQKGLATWASTAEVPEELTPYFALLMLQKLAGLSYSVPDSRYQRIQIEAGPDGEAALATLAELAIPEYDSTDDNGGF